MAPRSAANKSCRPSWRGEWSGAEARAMPEFASTTRYMLRRALAWLPRRAPGEAEEAKPKAPRSKLAEPNTPRQVVAKPNEAPTSEGGAEPAEESEASEPMGVPGTGRGAALCPAHFPGRPTLMSDLPASVVFLPVARRVEPWISLSTR